jgi:hypothetical protein
LPNGVSLAYFGDHKPMGTTPSTIEPDVQPSKTVVSETKDDVEYWICRDHRIHETPVKRTTTLTRVGKDRQEAINWMYKRIWNDHFWFCELFGELHADADGRIARYSAAKSANLTDFSIVTKVTQDRVCWSVVEGTMDSVEFWDPTD